MKAKSLPFREKSKPPIHLSARRPKVSRRHFYIDVKGIAPPVRGISNRQPASRRHLKEEIQPQEKENNIRRPPRQERRQLPDAPHRSQQLRSQPIENSNRHPNRHTTHRTT